MKKFFGILIIGLLLLMGPVNAYDLVKEYTVDSVVTTQSATRLVFDSVSTKMNITKIEWEGDCYPSINPRHLSDYKVVGWLGSNAESGYVNMTYDIDDNAQYNTWTHCRITYELSGVKNTTVVDPEVYYWGNSTQPLLNLKSYVSNVSTHPSAPYVFRKATNPQAGHYKLYGGLPEEPVVNFTGYPLDGYSPLSVLFTISNFSTVNSTGTSWTFGDGQTGTSTISTINHTYQNPGIYTVSMSYYNTSGVQSTITKNNYVLASIPTGMIVNLDVKNAITGALIQDSTVSIRNTTTGVWRNTTAPTGLVYFSTTDPGYLYPLSQNQSITLAANKSGYFPAAATFNIPYTNYLKQLFLMPTSIVNATGTGTVVVTVIRDKDDYFEPGISVVMDSGQIGVTNVAGAVTLFNVTAGDRVVKVTDPDGDYLSTEKSFTLVAGETKLLVMRIVRTGETPVITPVSPVPTVTGTYDPDDPNSPGYGNYTATQVNQAGSEGIVQMLGQLIALWPLIVLGIFMKFMKSAFT